MTYDLVPEVNRFYRLLYGHYGLPDLFIAQQLVQEEDPNASCREWTYRGILHSTGQSVMLSPGPGPWYLVQEEGSGDMFSFGFIEGPLNESDVRSTMAQRQKTCDERFEAAEALSKQCVCSTVLFNELLKRVATPA